MSTKNEGPRPDTGEGEDNVSTLGKSYYPEHIKLSTILTEQFDVMGIAREGHAKAYAIYERKRRNHETERAIWGAMCEGVGDLKYASVTDKNTALELLERELSHNTRAGATRSDKANLIADVLDDLGQYRFITLEDTETVYCYNNGVYERGEPVIKAAVERFLGDESTEHYVKETIGHIQRRTFIKRSEINKDRTRIPLMNGLFNLETFELEPFNEDAIYTYRIPITYEPAARCPAIETWINEIVEPDSYTMVQEFFGYCFEPKFPLHVTFWWYGTGRNGKGALVRLLVIAIGDENAAAVPLEQFDARYRFALMRLYNRFLNICSEPQTKFLLTTETFKKVTGGDRIDGEIKGKQETIPFTSFAKVIIMGNQYPNIEDDTFGFWERIRIVKFPKAFTGNEDIQDIELKKIEEDGGHELALSGFFNWCMQGLKRLKENNYTLTESRSSEDTKLEFQKVSNSIKAFIKEHVELKPSYIYPRQKLWEQYKEYCDENGLKIKEQAVFTKKIGEIPAVYPRSGRIEGEKVKVWQGLRYYGTGTDGTDGTPLKSREKTEKGQGKLLEEINPVPTVPTVPPAYTEENKNTDLNQTILSYVKKACEDAESFDREALTNKIAINHLYAKDEAETSINELLNAGILERTTNEYNREAVRICKDREAAP